MMLIIGSQMKKRVVKHARDIATEKQNYCYQYTDGKEKYYVTDGYRVIEYDNEIQCTPSISVNAHEDSIVRAFTGLFDRCNDYVLYELPTVEEIKANITKLVGRRYDKVVYGNDKFAINARWLYKAMEALNAKVCYIDKDQPYLYGILLYENDDLQSSIKELILPIRTDGKTGYWTV